MSSTPSLRLLPLYFQCPVSLSSLSEELFEEESFLLRRLRRVPSESELEELPSREARLFNPSRILLFPDLEESSLGEHRRPILSWTLRFPSLV